VIRWRLGKRPGYENDHQEAGRRRRVAVCRIVAFFRRRRPREDRESGAGGVRQLIESEGAEGTLLDARTPQEVREGHIEGAINLNFYDSDFREQLESLDESKPVYVYCRSGGRSGRAAKMLRAAGFPKVYDLEGGILAWKEADMPLVEESEKPER